MPAVNGGARITAFVPNPGTALVLANMKEATGSGKPLLQPDPTQPQPASDLREVKADRSVFFTSDRVALRATCRVRFPFLHTAALERIRLARS